MEGWPFPRYLGSCGRLVVSASTQPLRDFFGAAPEVAADLALQLLAVLRSMGTNDLNYFFYFTHVDAGTFGVFSNGHLFIRDASTLGIIDKEEGTQQALGLRVCRRRARCDRRNRSFTCCRLFIN